MSFASCWLPGWLLSSCACRNCCRYWNDPEMLSKLGRAMGPSFNFPGLTGAEGAEGAEGEGENEDAEAEEENLHTAASAGVYSQVVATSGMLGGRHVPTPGCGRAAPARADLVSSRRL